MEARKRFLRLSALSIALVLGITFAKRVLPEVSIAVWVMAVVAGALAILARPRAGPRGP